MQIEQMGFIRSMVRLCGDGWFMGWHERNAGNLSYRLIDEEAAACRACVDAAGAPWVNLGRSYAELAGQCVCVSGAGRCFRNAEDEPGQTFGVIELSGDGSAYRLLWGLEGGRPTSEFPTHLLAHAARIRADRRKAELSASSPHAESRVVYHAHCPNVIALSNILEPDSRVWTRALWQAMTEAILFFPDGLGVVPWMVPGGCEIAEASEVLLERHPACVWTQHGLFATGSGFDEAFGLAHMIEKTAGIYLQGRAACGGCEPPFKVADEQLRLICEESGVVPWLEFLG